MPYGRTILLRLTVTAAVFVTCGVSSAQPVRLPAATPPRYYPLRSQDPVGLNAHFARAVRQPMPTDVTFVRIVPPSTGTVEVFGSMPLQAIPLPQGWCGLPIGNVYRFRIAGLAEFEGVELYPTVEVLDRTHPPPGREAEFAVPIRFTVEEIDLALAGQLVTKVVYVEQPQLASTSPAANNLVDETLPSDANLIAEADLRGRPVAIVRLGARTPDPMRPDPEFFGPGGPVAVPAGPQLLPTELPE